MREKDHESLSWVIEDSNLFKKNEGTWSLSACASNKAKAIYSFELEFKGLISNSLIVWVTKKNIPQAFSGMQKIIVLQK